MKSLLSLVILIFLTTTSSMAREDSSSVKTPEVFIAGGIAYPYLPGEFKDYWNVGWNSGFGYGVSFSPGDVGYGTVYGDVEMARFAFDGSAARRLLNLHQTNLLINRNPSYSVAFMLNFKGTFSSTQRTVAPYFLMGIGYLYNDIGSITVSGDTTVLVGGIERHAFAWSFGVGVEVPVTQ